MFGLYSAKSVKKLVRQFREEYDAVLQKQIGAAAELKEQNRVLKARVLELEKERGSVSEAIIKAVEEGERIKRESALASENERRELALLLEKGRLLSDRLLARYPDGEDVASFSGYVEKLHELLDGEEEPQAEEPSEFDMDEVLNPKQPLDLAKLCKELGVMEEDDE